MVIIMIIDFHTHILPGLDDGAQSIEEAIELINVELQNDVSIIVTTPHYYPNKTSIDNFIKKRNMAYDRLLQECPHISLPGIRLGSQVHFDSSLLKLDNIHKLCIEGTDYMLIDLPLEKINHKLINELEILYTKHNITPIISHFDRHCKNNDYHDIQELMAMNILGEIDTSAFINITDEKLIKKLLKDNYINIISSDIHNITDKTIQLKTVSDFFYKKRRGKVFDRFMTNAKYILSNMNVEYII